MNWRKSTYSAQGECIEIRNDLSALRDSKNPDGPALHAAGIGNLLHFVKADDSNFAATQRPK